MKFIEKTNKDRKWNEAEKYFFLKNVKIVFEEGFETEVDLALTERELLIAIERANRNREDFKGIKENLFEKISLFFKREE